MQSTTMLPRCRGPSEASTSPRCERRACLQLPRGRRAARVHAAAMPQPQPGGHRGPHPLAAVGLATATTLKRRLADMLAMPNTPAPDSRFKYDVLGLGQAMVDYSASVDESLLAAFNVEKGGRRVISVQERGEVMATLDEAGCPSSVSPGGSLANSLVAVAKLSRSAGSGLRVAMAGSLGTDTLGEFFNSKMSAAGVSVLLTQAEQQHSSGDTTAAASLGASSSSSSPSCSGSEASCGGSSSSTAHTGTVMVLTTPDAQRSFLSFFTSDGICLDAATSAAVASSRVVVVEGYLWEMDGAFGYVTSVVKAAKAAGAQVVLTAGDPGVVSRHRDEILAVISLGIDMMFTNAEEAAQLVGMPCGHSGSGHSAAAATAVADVAAVLGTSVPVAVVTDGSRGSYICAEGQVHCIPPHWAPDGPVDTCGAGDAYAAGVIFSVLCGHGVRTAGEFGSRCASAVISKYGPQLSSKDAAALAQQLPEPVSPWVARLGLWGNWS